MIHLHSSHVPPPAATSSAKLVVAGADPEAAEVRLLQQLSARDREVRTHERAHAAAAGGLANGGPSFQFTRGPDGRLYATGGEVNIDVSPVANDPEATIEKAQKIRRAALAPTNPSQQDRAVAARATAMATEARVELQREGREQASAADSAGDLLGHGLVAGYAATAPADDTSIDIVV